MAGLYSISTRAPGTIITALLYNTDHQVHVDGRTPTFMDGYSDSVAQMQVSTDPFPNSVESLPLSLAGELERLRFSIAYIKKLINGGSSAGQWYEPLVGPGFTTVGARVQRTSSFAVASGGSGTTIDFTGATAEFNTDSTWSSGSPTRFTAPYNGKYFAACSVVWNTAGVGRRELKMGIGGVFDTTQPQVLNTSLGSGQRQALTMVVQLTAGQFVEFRAAHSAAGSVNLIGNASQSIVGALIFLGN